MASLSNPTRVEKLIGLHADLTRDFPLAYDAVADTIPRDTPADFSPLLYLVSPVDHAPSADTLPPRPERNPVLELPLIEWVEAQASWYDECGAEGSELIAAAIRRIRYEAEAYRCQTPAQVIERSPYFRKAQLDGITTPPNDERRSFLAELIDAEVDGYLLEQTDLARLVAWQLLQLADEAEHYCVQSERAFIEARRQAEAEAFERMMDEEHD